MGRDAQLAFGGMLLRVSEGRKYTNIRRLRQSGIKLRSRLDNVNPETNVIDWNEATNHRPWTTRSIREAVRIRQESDDVVNSDERALYHLSHVFDDLLLSAATSRRAWRTVQKGSSCCRNVTGNCE